MTQVMHQADSNAGVALDNRAQEVFQSLWASLFYSGRTSGNSVVLSSAVRHEGTSTVAAGLALAGSHRAVGARVALVDFNLRNPALHKILGVKNQPGVSEMFDQGLDAADVVQHVKDGLDFYPAGETYGKILSVLRSESLGEFLTKLSQSYDQVLIDTAAACHAPDTRSIATRVKEVVLVAKADSTPREAVQLGRQRIESGDAKIVGMVLNQRDFPIPEFLYNRV